MCEKFNASFVVNGVTGSESSAVRYSIYDIVNVVQRICANELAHFVIFSNIFRTVCTQYSQKISLQTTKQTNELKSIIGINEPSLSRQPSIFVMYVVNTGISILRL